MAETNTKKLGRPLSAVKKQSSTLTLKNNYYSDIKPFLFGTSSTETLTLDNIPNTGIHSNFSGSGLIPGTSADTPVHYQGNRVSLQRADIYNQDLILELENGTKKASTYIFPSDIVSILTSIAKLFLKGENNIPFAKDEIERVVTSSSTSTSLVSSWADITTVENNQENKVKLFFEKDIFSGSNKIDSLLAALTTAAIQYEFSLKKIDRTGFYSVEEIKSELTILIIPKILDQIEEYKKNIEDKKEEQFKKADEDIQKEIKDKIDEDTSFYDPILEDKEILRELKDLEILHRDEPKALRLKKTSTGDGLLESTQYKKFEEEVIKKFLADNKEDLIKKHIKPLLTETTEDEASTEGSEGDEDTDGADVDDDTTEEEENYTVQRDELNERAGIDLANVIIHKFIDQIDIERFNPYKNSFFDYGSISDERDKLLSEISTATNEFTQSDNFITPELSDWLIEQNILRETGFENDVFESTWYTDHINNGSFISNQESNYYDNLYQEHILPIIIILEAENETANFTITRDQFDDKSLEDLTLSIFKNVISSINEPRFSSYKNNFFNISSIEDERDNIANEIARDVDIFINSDSFLPQTEVNTLLDSKSINTENIFVDNIFETDWYREYINTKSLTTFINIHDDYSNKIYENHIMVIIAKLELSQESEEVIATPDEEAPTVPAQARRDSEVSETEVITEKPDEKSITQIQLERSNQAEEIYKIVLQEQFTQHGLTEKDLSPELVTALRQKAILYNLSLSEHDRLMLFMDNQSVKGGGLESDLFAKFYNDFSKENKPLLDVFYSDLQGTDTWSKLSDNQRAGIVNSSQNTFQNLTLAVKPLKTSEDVLKDSLKEVLNSDSPVLNQNVSNTIDALIIQYGLNQAVYDVNENNNLVKVSEGNNKHDVVWRIEHLDTNSLLLLFGIPPDIKIDQATLAELKEVLISYTKKRASELNRHTQSNAFDKGISQITDEEAERILAGDAATISSHREMTGSLRSAVEKNGGETVAGGLNEGKKSKRKAIIKKQFKTFLPFWNGVLSPEEQRVIYDKFNIPYQKDDPKAKLEFIPEFLFFDMSQLDSVNEIARNNQLSAKQKEEINAIMAMSEQLVREEAFANFVRDSYLYQSDDEEIYEIALLANVDVEDIGELSPMEMYGYNDDLQQGYVGDGSRFGTKSRGGRLRNRFRKSKLGKRLSGKEVLKKKAKDKLKKSLEKSAVGAASKAFSAAASGTGVGTAIALLNTAAQKIGYKKVFAVIGGITAILIGRTIYALGSFGGLLGGLIGGIYGGPLGFIGGSIGGNLLMPTRIASLFGGGKVALANTTSAPPTAKPSFVAKTGGAVAKPIAFIAALPIAVLAPASAMVMMGGITVYIILMIQSAFLIPIPDNFNTGISGSIGELGPNGFECFVFGEGNKQITGQSGNSLVSKEWTVSEKQRTYDAYTRKAGRNQCFNSYACDNGTVTIYRAEHPTFGGWAPRALGGDVIILYDAPFQDPDTGVPYTSINGLEYTFIHEIAHTISHKGISDFLNKFLTVWNRNHCLTYPFPNSCSAGEAFAESIALYVNYETYEYEFNNGVKLDTKAPYDFPNQATEEYKWVRDNIFDDASGSCEGLIQEAQNSYIAIGPLTRENIVASSAQEIRNPQLTCSWRDGKDLAVAVNANFFNTDEATNILTPVGLAGNPDVQYYEDATNPSFNPHLKAFGFEGNTPRTITGGSTALRSSQISPLNLAVTGSFSDVQVSAESNNKRTILGTGIANGSCSQEYAGQQVLFLAVYTSSTFTNAERELAECGATNFIHLDGGGSSQFCSDEASFEQNRFIPVNIGMREAEIIEGK